jgi:hypothetical protein
MDIPERTPSVVSSSGDEPNNDTNWRFDFSSKEFGIIFYAEEDCSSGY